MKAPLILAFFICFVKACADDVAYDYTVTFIPRGGDNVVATAHRIINGYVTLPIVTADGKTWLVHASLSRNADQTVGGVLVSVEDPKVIMTTQQGSTPLEVFSGEIAGIPRDDATVLECALGTLRLKVAPATTP